MTIATAYGYRINFVRDQLFLSTTVSARRPDKPAVEGDTVHAFQRFAWDVSQEGSLMQ